MTFFQSFIEYIKSLQKSRMTKMKTEVSQIFKKDLMSGNGKYVKNSYLIFDHIQIGMEKDALIINFFYNDELLATTRQEDWPSPGSIHFRLLDGQMKMDLI